MPQFFVDEVVSEEKERVEWTIYVLNQAKNGYNKIAFGFSDQSRLQSVLMQCFLGPRSFDFEINDAKSKDLEKKLGKGHCVIRSIRLS